MSHVVRVVCRAPMAPAFELAGVEVTVAPDLQRTLEALKKLSTDTKVAIALLDEALHRALPTETRHRLDRQAQPMVAPFPVPSWDECAAAEEYVLEILRQAIGYRVRPR